MPTVVLPFYRILLYNLIFTGVAWLSKVRVVRCKVIPPTNATLKSC